MRLLLDIKWELDMPDDLRMDEWYLVISNHQSWADILALQYAINNVVPYFRFFLKKELRWVPLLNIAWWALDYPYMTRYSKEFIEKNPHLKGKDIETTRKSCAKFKDIPVSIMNFVEGTRFKEEKHKKQNSPYKHLLKPNAGGIAFVLGAMGEQLTCILDVTIAYPEGRREIWDFMCGRVPEVKIKVVKVPITENILGDYFNDEEFKAGFQQWLNDFWAEKDRTMDKMLQ
jgi:1-acyl-sn-glycerol-3-phosphate acyltransferase